MKTTIDRAGRVVIPRDVRRQAGWGPGTLPLRLERRGRFLVAVPLVDVPPLTAEDVEATRDALRREREASF
jgi:AbrB family looped-hinge helix DNA binding protein